MGNKKSFTDEEILESIKVIIGEIMMISPDEISGPSSLIDDLGLESIDFIDITFRLEENFDIVIPRVNPIQRVANMIGEEELIKDGKITKKAADLLKIAFQEVEPSRINEGMQETDILSLLTPQSYVNVVKRALEIADWKPKKCDKCDKTDFIQGDKDKLEFPNNVIPFGPVFLCKSCYNMMIAPSHEDMINEQFRQLSA